MPSDGARPSARPNVVLILCDDLGAGDLGCTGARMTQTPNIDRLRAAGMLFTAAYSSSPVCAPSRAALLTGRSMAHCQIRDNQEVPNLGDGTFGGQAAIAPRTETLARLLQSEGYATAIFGKWGLGGPGELQGHPLDQGFERFTGVLCQRNAHNHYPAYIDRDRSRVVLQGNDRSASGSHYLPEIITDEAIEWIDSVRRGPFFLYFATPLPHLALQVPEEELARFSFAETPYDGGNGYLAHPRPRAAYAAMVWSIDQAVGRIVDELGRLGILKDTLIIFTSDNGATFRIGGFDPEFFRSGGDLRGHKGQLYEGGIRVPLIASWQGKIEPGSTCDEPVVGYDIFRTVAGAVGALPKSEVDGVNLIPYMLGESQCAGLALRAPIVWEHPAGAGWQAVREGDWKLVRREAKNAAKAHFELYDLAADPAESRDLASEHPEVVARLSRQLLDRTPSTRPEWNYAPITVEPVPAGQ